MKDPSSSTEQNQVFSYLLKLAASPPVKAFMDPPKVTSTVWAESWIAASGLLLLGWSLRG